MANPDIIGTSSDIKSYVPPETQKLLKDLEKDLQTSMSTDTNFQRVRDQLKDLRSKYSNLKEDLDAIEVYLRYLEYQKVIEKKALLEESKKGFSALSSRHGRISSVGEDSTTGSVGVRMSDTTNAGIDATGKPTPENGSTIIHGDNDWNRSDVQRQIEHGKALLKSMPTTTLQSPDSQSGETLVANIQELKTSFEKALNTPVTNQELQKRLLPLNETTSPSDRILAIQMIFEWMRFHDLIILVNQNGYEVRKSQDNGKSFAIQQEFMNILNAHNITKTDVQQSLVLGSEYFNNFVETSTVNGKLTHSLDIKEYLRQLAQKYNLPENPSIKDINSNKDILPRDRDLLLSASMDKTFSSVDIQNQAQMVLDFQQDLADIEKSNPQYRSVLQGISAAGNLSDGLGTNNGPAKSDWKGVWPEMSVAKTPTEFMNRLNQQNPNFLAGSWLLATLLFTFMGKDGKFKRFLMAAIGLPVLAAVGPGMYKSGSEFLFGSEQEATNRLKQALHTDTVATLFSRLDVKTYKDQMQQNIDKDNSGLQAADRIVSFQDHIDRSKHSDVLESPAAKWLGSGPSSLWDSVNGQLPIGSIEKQFGGFYIKNILCNTLSIHSDTNLLMQGKRYSDSSGVANGGSQKQEWMKKYGIDEAFLNDPSITLKKVIDIIASKK